MSDFQKKVFVIIVSYNGEKWLNKNLSTLNESSYPVNTIIVDNCSSDGSVSIIKSFSNVYLIKLDKNLGFGKANNLAIKKALQKDADYLFLLNQDTWVYYNTIEKLVKTAELNSSYGLVSPLHYSGDEVHLDQNFKTYWNRKSQSISEVVDELPFVNAAAWLIPKEVISKVGFFEPLFSHYGEDRNYVDRLKYHGYKVVLAKNSKICHDRIISRSFKKDRIQSKLKILSEALNINHNLFFAYLNAFRSVFGLPKYFSKYYSKHLVFKMFITLFWYYITLKFKVYTILKTRNEHK